MEIVKDGRKYKLPHINTSSNGTPLQYSCMENPVDRGAWWAEVHGVSKSQTRLSDFTLTFQFHALAKEVATHSSVFLGESQGQGSLVGCRLWGCTESDMESLRLNNPFVPLTPG